MDDQHHLGGGVMSVLDDYTPTGLDPAAWAAVKAPVAALLDAVDDELAVRCRHVLGRIAVWAHDRGHDVTADLLLRDELWAMWLAVDATATSAPTYRSALRALAAAHRVELSGATGQLPLSTRAKRIYTLGEIDRMLEHASKLSTDMARRVAALLVLCCAGAGPGRLRPVRPHPAAVPVAGRPVAHRRAWQPLPAHRGRAAALRPADLGRRVRAARRPDHHERTGSQVVDRPGAQPLPRLGRGKVSAHDLRRTWLATLYAAGVHLYNTERPHRAVGRRTPAEAYHARPKAGPAPGRLDPTRHRIRHDRIDTNGVVTLRHHSRRECCRFG